MIRDCLASEGVPVNFGEWTKIDFLLLGLSAFTAVAVLVRMMSIRHKALSDELRVEIQAEQQRLQKQRVRDEESQRRDQAFDEKLQALRSDSDGRGAA